MIPSLPAPRLEPRPDIAAVILAAGFSSRMVRFKPALPLAGIPALVRCARLFRETGISEVRVVTGARREELGELGELAETLEALGLREVRNPDPAAGMFSSLQAAARELAVSMPGLAAAFVLPVDIPLVRPSTVRRLLAAWDAACAQGPRPHLVLRPAFLGEPGHPPLVGVGVLAAAAAWTGDAGLRGCMAACGEVCDVAVADRGVLLDMDTPADYARLAARADRAARMAVPDPDECRALFELLSAQADPTRREEVRAHSREVARAALRLARRLAEDQRLRVDLVLAGALLHDIAKGRPAHAAAGAELLAAEGYPELADVVATHAGTGLAEVAADVSAEALGGVTEAHLVYLADKYVQGAEQVGLEERFAAKAAHFASDPGAVAAVMGVARRLDQARGVRAAVAQAGGCDPEQALTRPWRVWEAHLERF